MVLQRKTVAALLAIALLIAGTLLAGGCSQEKSVSSDSPKTTSPQSEQNHTELLKQINELAKQGKLTTSGDFGIRSPQKEIEAKWGKPDPDSKKNELKYSKHAITFKVANDLTDSNHQWLVYSLNSSDSSYTSITYDEVKKTLGKAQYDEIQKNQDTGKEEGLVEYPGAEGTLNALQIYFSVKDGKMDKITSIEIVEGN